MRTVNIVAIHRLSPADRAQIEAVDPAVRLTDAGGWFDGEIRDSWSAYAGRDSRPRVGRRGQRAPSATGCSAKPK